MLRTIGDEYGCAGFPENAYYYYKQALDSDGDSSMFYNYLSANEFGMGNFEKSIEYRNKAYSLDSTHFYYVDIIWPISHLFLGNYKESLNVLINILRAIKLSDSQKIFICR